MWKFSDLHWVVGTILEGFTLLSLFRYLISNSKDQTIKLWDLRRFSSEETVVRALSGIECLMVISRSDSGRIPTLHVSRLDAK